MQHDAEIIDISLEQYRHFMTLAHSLKSSAGWSFDLFRCRDSVRSLSAFAAATLPDVAPRIERLLDDAGTGMVAVDVPADPDQTDNANVVAGVGLILGLFGNLGPSRMDELRRSPFASPPFASPPLTSPPLTFPPFTFHMAAQRHDPHRTAPPHRRALACAMPGRRAFGAGPALHGTPGALGTPRTVALYDLHLAHPEPGKFIWMPTGRRDERDRSGALPASLGTSSHAPSQALAGQRIELAVEPKARRAILFRHPGQLHARETLQAPLHGGSGGAAFIRITDGPASA